MTAEARIFLLRRAIAAVLDGRSDDAEAIIGEIEATAAAFYGVEHAGHDAG